MRFALIVTNLRGGGAEKAMLKVAALLAARGHDARLVLLEHIVDHGVAPAVALSALTPAGVEAGKGYLGKRLLARRLRRHLERLAESGAFDAVISTLPFADEVAALARLPRLWHRIANTLSAEVEMLRESNPRKAQRRLARYRRLYSGAHLVAVSDGVAEDLATRIGVAGATLATIPNPFDFAAIRALAAARVDAIPAQPYVIHVGRFARQKRHDLLLAAWQRAAPGGKLVLLAHPEAGLLELIRQHGLENDVIVAGFQSNPYPWIRAAKLLVLCSDHEGLPNVLIEALACGTPVVSTDCPSGPREIMTGPLVRFLVPTGDAGALAAAMRLALAQPPDLSALDLQRYSEAAVAAAWEALPRRWH